MHVNIQNSGKGGNSGSSAAYVNYLEKENDQKPENEKEHFFSSEKDNIKPFEVIESIDNNKHKLKAKDSKFYSVTLSPSQEELKHIGNDKEKLKQFTRSAMDEYAKNFKREGINGGKDLVYFAKIEQNRHYKGKDQAIKDKELNSKGELIKQGDKKEGLNAHVHIIVARYDKQKYKTLCPTISDKYTTKGKLRGKNVTKGFDREQFDNNVEKAFDKQTEYKREFQDTFEFKNSSREEQWERVFSEREKAMEVVQEPIKEKEVIQEKEPIKEEKLKEQEQQKDKGLDLSDDFGM